MVYSKYFFFFFFISLIFGLIFFDEEPLFNFSDLNIFNIVFFTICVVSVVLENRFKILNGYYSNNDSNTFMYSISYTLNLFIYFYIVWFIFFLHLIVPGNVYLVDSLFYFNKILNCYILILNKFLFLILLIMFLLKIMLVSNSFNINKIICSVLLVITTISSILLIFDFSINNNSSSISKKNNLNFFNSEKHSVLYSASSNKNGFDWHLAVDDTYTIGFVGFYSILFYALSSLFMLLFLLFFYISLYEYDLNKIKTNFGRGLLWFVYSYIFFLSLLILFLYIVFFCTNFYLYFFLVI